MTPLRDQLLSLAGEFFDLNQETGTIIPGMPNRVIGRAQYDTHRVTPNFLLAADEQAEVIAYILSLK